MENSDVPPSHPPPPPPKRLSRPKITLEIPDSGVFMPHRGPATGASIHWGPHSRLHVRPPGTAASHVSDPAVNPYFNPFMHMYHNKASDFMFKQFEGFKDFTMNTAKSGLSAGEKSAFWFVSKLRSLSKRWFTHFFLTLCLVLYSVLGALTFSALEGPHEDKFDNDLTGIRRGVVEKIQDVILKNRNVLQYESSDFLQLIEADLQSYEADYTNCMKNLNNNDARKKTWSFWNSMFYAGTIYTTIGKNTIGR